eukprot:Nitzschia sp. Nitz4//scaffold43_size134323//110297//111388//NITZ4_003318-RA/size134323-processed-gene-0.69-mRNA-1//-1//CDS//3329552005//4190//frame0
MTDLTSPNNHQTPSSEGLSDSNTLLAPLVSDVESNSITQTPSSYQKDNNESSEAHPPSRSSVQGRLLLLAVAFLFGSLNVTLRLIYQQDGPPSASALSSSRQWLSVLFYIPIIANYKPEPRNATPVTSTESTQESSRSLWSIASELALYNFLAQGLLTIGLLSTPSARASFFFQSTVIMTPVLSACVGHTVRGRIWFSCAVALVGLVCLSDKGGLSMSFSLGDLLCLTGAFCWSLYIFRISIIGASVDEIHLQSAKTLVIAVLYSCWFGVAQALSGVSLWEGVGSVKTWLWIAYSAFGPGIVADVLQQWGQSTVTAAEANVILSLEPVFTALLAFFLIGEATTVSESIGGALIVSASLISSTS